MGDPCPAVDGTTASRRQAPARFSRCRRQSLPAHGDVFTLPEKVLPTILAGNLPAERCWSSELPCGLALDDHVRVVLSYFRPVSSSTNVFSHFTHLSDESKIDPFLGRRLPTEAGAAINCKGGKDAYFLGETILRGKPYNRRSNFGSGRSSGHAAKVTGFETRYY